MRASSSLIYFGTQAAPERRAAARARAVRAVQVRPARLFQLAREAHNCVVQGSTGGWNSRYAERPAVVTLARLTAGAVGAPFTCSRLSCTFFRCTKKKKKKKVHFIKSCERQEGTALRFIGILSSACSPVRCGPPGRRCLQTAGQIPAGAGLAPSRRCSREEAPKGRAPAPAGCSPERICCRGAN